ncbi:MBL fold metallo-hydrolase [Qipengyuania nanhaisediminis]|uniref:MBL fold metallo-hydrolase n=1 Tax=Qipengyuania nanhaisediminis TaxID=604088 RepID=UPI0038B3672C
MFARIAIATLALAACAPAAPDTHVPIASAENRSPDLVRFSQECEPWDDWDKPAAPFQVHANTYYVGTCGIAAILIKGDERHVLIDSGTEAGAEVVLANLAALGVDPAAIGILLYSHEHFDHVAGMQFLQEASGAVLIASELAAPVLSSGIVAASDPQSGMHEAFPAVGHVTTGLPAPGEAGHPVYLEAIELMPVATPGHSPGAMSWQWQACEQDGAACLDIVYADSLSPISRDDYRFSDHPEYLARYRAGLDRIAALDCDILLTPHPSHSLMVERAATGTLRGGMTCAQYAAKKHGDLDARLAREAVGE